VSGGACSGDACSRGGEQEEASRRVMLLLRQRSIHSRLCYSQSQANPGKSVALAPCFQLRGAR
jgi:hypothetical protein